MGMKVEQLTVVLTFHLVKMAINYITSYKLMGEEGSRDRGSQFWGINSKPSLTPLKHLITQWIIQAKA